MGHLKSTLKDALWHAEPPSWHLAEDALALTTGAETDFWQGTYYGFRRDDGHFLGCAVTGDFTAHVTFEADYEVLYDQAGLMLRADARTWLKAGIEYSDGVMGFSTVLTRDGQSDWSMSGKAEGRGPQRIRLTRLGEAVIVHRGGEDGLWHLMRLGHLPAGGTVRVGPMACSPQRAGLSVRFLAFDIAPPVANPLHAD